MLSQVEADALIAMPKRFLSSEAIDVWPGVDQTRVLQGQDREEFLLDIWRGTLRLSRLKLQERARKTVVLIRVDVHGAPHTNPDGTRLEGTHVHVYREGFEDKWAHPLDASQFPDTASPSRVFQAFCRYCNILDPPPVQEVLM